MCEVKFLDGSDIEVASKNVNETRKWCDILNKSLDVEWLRSFRDALVPGLRGNRDAHIIMLTDDNDDEPDALETQLDTGASVSVELPEHVRSSSNSSASAARSGHHKNIESSDFYKNSWPSPVDDESSHQFPMKCRSSWVRSFFLSSYPLHPLHLPDNNPTALTTQQQTSLENDARKLDHKQDKASSISANMISKPPSIPNTMPVAKYLPTPPKRAPAPVKKSVSQSSLYLIDNLAQDLFMAIPEAPMPNTVFATNPKPNILPKPTSIANGDNQITSPGSARAGGAQGGKPNKISIPQRRSQAEVIQEFLRSKSEPNFSDFITASNHQQQNSPYIASRGSLYSQHSEFAEVKFDKDKQHQRYSTGALSQDTVDKLNDLMLDIVSGMLATPITTAEVNASKMRFSETNRPDHRRNSSRGGGGAVLTKNANSLIILDPVPPTQAATDAASLIQKGLDDIANVPTLVRKNTFGKKQAQEMKNNSSIIGNNTNMKDSSDSLNKDQQESQPQPPISNEMKKTKSQTFGTELAREMSLKIHTILNNGQEQHQESSQTAVKSQQQPQQTAAPKSAGGPNSGTYTTVKSSNLVSEHIDYLWYKMGGRGWRDPVADFPYSYPYTGNYAIMESRL